MGLFQRLTMTSFRTVVEAPDGMSKVNVYTYDGRPLKKVRVGEKFRVTLMVGEHKMKSVYTGTTANGNVAISYNGKPIGFLSTSKNANLLVSVRDRVGPLSLVAERTGTGKGGWPEIVVTFDRKWMLANK